MDIFRLMQKVFVRLRTVVMNPFKKLVKKVKLLFNANTIATKVVTPFNKKVRELLSIKPKSKEDYFSIGIFWVSKKLMFCLILAVCAFTFLYFTKIAEPVDDTVEASNIKTTVYFEYDDLKLSEFTGRANIRAANGKVVYSGDIVAGVCTGMGTLWNQSGTLIYEGEFEDNNFSGYGTNYYPNGKIKYQGEFINNEYSGTGTAYFQDGKVEYEGSFENGSYFGNGSLYNEEGKMIYSGNFENSSFNGTGTAFHENGTKKYEGEFYLGKAQGLGTSYSVTGKLLFTGQFARNQIQYESLLNASMDAVMEMCNESPKIYYSGKSTCFLFEGLNIALETNCVVEMKKKETETSSGQSQSWYLPGEDLDQELLLEGEEDTVAVDYPGNLTTDGTQGDGDSNDNGNAGSDETDSNKSADNNTEQKKDDVDLPMISTAGRFNAYFYLDSGVWQEESQLDYSKIQVTSVVVFNPEFDVDFLNEVNPSYYNGEADLLECVAIEQLRQKEPTLFSHILFSQSAKTKKYIQISGINLAEAIHVEDYDVDHVTYRLCYDIKDGAIDYENWKFVRLKSY